MLALVRPLDGHEYYAYYVLTYVDDVLVLYHVAEEIHQQIDKYFKMKFGFIGNPDIYLGAAIKKMCLHNGVEMWSSSPLKYVWASLDTVVNHLTNLGDEQWSMPKKASNPCKGGYKPELDVTPLLNPELAL